MRGKVRAVVKNVMASFLGVKEEGIGDRGVR